MAKPVSIAKLGRQLAEAQTRVDELRSQLDEQLFLRHQAGEAIRRLALEAGISRETAYRAIERGRAQFGS
jgi:hypothetical protein